MKEQERKKKSFHHTSRRTEHEISIQTSLEAAWEAWATPRGISSWFTDSAEGEVREGETYHWVFEHFGYRFPYRVVRVDPSRRLVLEFAFEGRPPGVIDVQFAHEGGTTTVRVVNSGFLDGSEWDDEFEGVDSGWQMMLATLRYWLETAPEGRKRAWMVSRTTRAGLGKQAPFFVEAGRLRRWLGETTPQKLSPGPFSLRLAGDLLRGRVEAATRNEVLLSLDGLSSLLALKAFSRAGTTELGLHFVTWSDPGETFFELHREHFEEAVAKLVQEVERGSG